MLPPSLDVRLVLEALQSAHQCVCVCVYFGRCTKAMTVELKGKRGKAYPWRLRSPRVYKRCFVLPGAWFVDDPQHSFKKIKTLTLLT